MKKYYLENEYCSFWIENGIIHEVFKSNVKILDLKISKEIVEDRLKVSNNILRPLYVDATCISNFKPDAQKYMSEGDAMKHLSACALLAKNTFHRLLGNTYMKVNKPSIEMRMFTDKAKALVWLNQYK